MNVRQKLINGFLKFLSVGTMTKIELDRVEDIVKEASEVIPSLKSFFPSFEDWEKGVEPSGEQKAHMVWIFERLPDYERVEEFYRDNFRSSAEKNIINWREYTSVAIALENLISWAAPKGSIDTGMLIDLLKFDRWLREKAERYLQEATADLSKANAIGRGLILP